MVLWTWTAKDKLQGGVSLLRARKILEVDLMKRVFQLIALVAALTLPALCQSARLSPDDQHDFDKAYTKWVNDTRRNDRDDIAKDIHKMQEIMARNNIPASVPYDRIASTGNGYRGRSYQAQLSPEDQ